MATSSVGSAADPLQRGGGLELLWMMASMCEMSAVRIGRPCALNHQQEYTSQRDAPKGQKVQLLAPLDQFYGN